MEREKEILKLVNVLRQTSRTALQAIWMSQDGGDAAARAVGQYNRVRARLAALDPEIGDLFEPLDEGSALAVVAMACRQLAAYYADEVGGAGWPDRGGWPGGPGAPFDREAFKDFWRKSADEIESLGEHLRESLGPWFAHRRRPSRGSEGPSEGPGEREPRDEA